jgi:hypothetical protein
VGSTRRALAGEGVEGPNDLKDHLSDRRAKMRKAILLLALITGLSPKASAAQTVSGAETIITKATQAVSFNGDLDVGGFERFSIQVDFSSAPSATAGITDGAYSSATIAVVSTQAFRGFSSSVTITVVNSFNMGLTSITINGHSFIEGTDWNRYAFSSTVTAQRLATVINDYNSEYQANASSNVVLVQANSTGTLANAWTIRSSSRTALILSGGAAGGVGTVNESSTTFHGGQAAGYFSIAGITLTEGTDFNAITSTDTTAYNIVAAIAANTSLSALLRSTHSAFGKFTVIATTSGVYDYPISVSTTAALAPDYSRYQLSGGSATEVDVDTNTFYEPNHSFATGQAVLYSTTSNTSIIFGLTFGTTYYAIRYDDNKFRVATSSPNAMLGVSVDVSSVAGRGGFTFAPLAYANQGGTGFLWQGSNDGLSWSNLPLTADRSSFTYTQYGSTTIPFISYPFRWLRMKFTPPATGGMNLRSFFFGRRD